MKPQVWVGDSQPKKSKVNPIIEGERKASKPIGGIWTSPLQNNTSEWIQFSSKAESKQKWVLIPNSDVNVLQLKSKSDLSKVEIYKKGLFKTLNYEELFKTYDGIYYSSSFYCQALEEWSVESIIWDGWYFKEKYTLQQYIQ